MLFHKVQNSQKHIIYDGIWKHIEKVHGVFVSYHPCGLSHFQMYISKHSTCKIISFSSLQTLNFSRRNATKLFILFKNITWIVMYDKCLLGYSSPFWRNFVLVSEWRGARNIILNSLWIIQKVSKQTYHF